MPAFFIFTLVYLFRRISRFFATHYAIDARALGLMRIGTALVVLCDLLIRGSDLTAHYTNQGIWPTQLLTNFGWKTGFWSLHSLYGSYGWALFLFCCHGFFALCLLLGYYTRFATLMVWLFAISLHNRNLFILQSGDDLLRLLLLWGLFLPWHRRYALDTWSNRGSATLNTTANIGYLFLIASVYFFTVSLKRSAEWHGEGSAIYYALSLEQLRLPGGDWLYQYPQLMRALTWFVFYAELLIPVLILLPQKKGVFRLAGFLLLLLIHAGIGLTLYVGLFFIINIISGLALLPGFVFDRAERLFHLNIKESPVTQTPNPFRFLKTGACIILIILCLIVNLGSVNWFPYQLRTELQYGVNALRLNQYWGMFSPSVLKTDGWFVYHGADALGRQWDLRLNQDYVDYKKPDHIVSMYKSDRWRKLAENMQNNHCTFLRPLYCKYLLHRWNGRHPEKKLTSLNLYFLQKNSLPDYRVTAVEKKLFCICLDD